MTERYFENITVTDRAAKPRETGVTMLIDWGLGVAHQQDLLAIAGEYMDIAKIAVGISGLLPARVLEEKISIYRMSGVEPFPGGQYLEYAVSRGLTEAFFSDAKAAGYTLVEVSDNTAPFAPDFKRDLIRRAREEFGFRVLGEVGSKVKITETDEVLGDVENCLEAGAWKIFIEAADMFEGREFRHDLIEALTARFPLDRLIFELPGWWLGPIGTEKIPTLNALISNLGPDANLGNIGPEELLYLETNRRKTGVSGFQ